MSGGLRAILSEYINMDIAKLHILDMDSISSVIFILWGLGWWESMLGWDQVVYYKLIHKEYGLMQTKAGLFCKEQ